MTKSAEVDGKTLEEKARLIALEAHCRYCPGEANDPRLKCKSDIAFTTEDIIKLAQQAIEDERERCCKDVCAFCASGAKVNEYGDHELETLDPGKPYLQQCLAWLIRARGEKGSGK